ncbi:hypothetical protein K9M41_02685 [Candidatus Gracilibacteria bacterium]|nr:hypothetical protein [Candidatus Gracilibacteria bacterium]
MKNLYFGFGLDDLTTNRFLFNDQEVRKIQTAIEDSSTETGKEHLGENPAEVEESERKLLEAYENFENKLQDIGDTPEGQQFRTKAQEYVIAKDKEIDENDKHLEEDLAGLDAWLEDHVQNLYNPEATSAGLQVQEQWESIGDIDELVSNLGELKSGLKESILGNDIPQVLADAEDIEEIIQTVLEALQMEADNPDDDLKYKLNQMQNLKEAITQIKDLAQEMLDSDTRVDFANFLSLSPDQLFLATVDDGVKQEKLEDVGKYKELMIRANGEENELKRDTFLLAAKQLRNKVDPNGEVLKGVDNIPFDKEEQAIQEARQEKLRELEENAATLVARLETIKQEVTTEQVKEEPDENFIASKKAEFLENKTNLGEYKNLVTEYGFDDSFEKEYGVNLNIGIDVSSLHEKLAIGDSLIIYFETNLENFSAKSIAVVSKPDEQTKNGQELFVYHGLEGGEVGLTRSGTIEKMSIFSNEDETMYDYRVKVGVQWSESEQMHRNRFSIRFSTLINSYRAATLGGDPVQVAEWNKFVQADHNSTLYKSFRSASSFDKNRDLIRHDDWIKASFAPLQEGANGYEPYFNKEQVEEINRRKEEEARARQERERIKQERDLVMDKLNSLPSGDALQELDIKGLAGLVTQLEEFFDAREEFEDKYDDEHISIYRNAKISEVRKYIRGGAEFFVNSIKDALESSSLEEVNQAISNYGVAENFLDILSDLEKLLDDRLGLNAGEYRGYRETELVLPKKRNLERKKSELEE